MLLGVYRTAHATGVLRTRAGRAVYERSYDLYKSRLEAAAIDALRQHVTPGSWIIDVGANIGFFTLHFGQWVGAGGKVLAIEPEVDNQARLVERISRERLSERVDVICAAVSDRPGRAVLELNPDHPADHRLSVGGQGIPVDAVTLDGIAEKYGWPDVSLVKIDVQGAEPRVIAGAHGLLKRSRPALFIEFDPAGLARMGSTVAALYDQLAALGYVAHSLGRRGIGPALTRDHVVGHEQYTDYLLLPSGR